MNNNLLHKDRPRINYMKMKWERWHLYILWTIAGILLIITSIVVRHLNTDYKPKEGDIVILGKNGSMKLAKPENVDEKDVKIGIIISSGDSVCFTVLGRVEDVNTVDFDNK